MTTITIERNVDEVNKSPSLYSMTGDIKHVNTMMVNRHALSEVLAHIDAQSAEIEQLRKDAERYRWLKKTTNWISSKGQRINVRDFPKSWDEHIDAAMKGTP